MIPENNSQLEDDPDDLRLEKQKSRNEISELIKQVWGRPVIILIQARLGLLSLTGNLFSIKNN